MNAWVESTFLGAHHGLHGLYASSPQSQPNSRLGPDAVSFLRSHFKQDPKPSTAFKRQLAQELQVDIAKINNWFQNERAKAKSQARVEQQRRLNGESTDDNDQASPSSSSASPAIEQVANHASTRPPPLALHTLPSSSSTDLHQFEALDLPGPGPGRPQNMHFEMPMQSGMVPMSAPAHITSFPHAQLMSPWTNIHGQVTPTTITLQSPTQPIHSATPTFIPATQTPLLYTEIPTADLSWPAQFSAPLSAGFDGTFGSDFDILDPTLNFETPLHSAQIDGTFNFSSPNQEEPTFIADPQPWTIPPQLSPSESFHEPSVVSESLPMTPASYGPETFQTVDPLQVKDVYTFVNNAHMAGEVTSAPSVSPVAPYETVAPSDLVGQVPPRPSSTQPASSFTRKRNIEIPQLSLNASSSLSVSNPKLRGSKSMGTMRGAPRSPLRPTADATRRVSKSPAHVRPQLPTSMPPVPPLPAMPAMQKMSC